MPTPSEILTWTPEEIGTWLHTRPSEKGFKWLALAEGAAMAANSPSSTDPARRDALGDLAVYAFEMAVREDEGSRAGALLSELTLRAGLIQRLGTASRTVRDADTLIALICQEVQTADNFKDKIREGPLDLASTPRSDLRALRHIKNVLRATELFLSAKACELPESIFWWWSRRDNLP